MLSFLGRIKNKTVSGAPLLAALLVAASSLTGCGSATGDVRNSAQTLELYNWLLNPGEREALQELVNLDRETYPGTTVINARGNSIGASLAQLQVRMQGVPPDTFQSVGGDDLLQWVLTNGQDDTDSKLEPVDSFVTDSGIANQLPEHLKESLSYHGALYAVPISVNRVNSLFYNVQIFHDLGLTPPATLADFYQVAAVIKAAGKIPLSIGTAEGAIISDFLFDGLLIDKAGTDYREAYFRGEMDADPAGQPILDALNELAKVLDYTNEDRDTLLWPDAALKVVRGEAAMTYVGDWARGFFKSVGLAPGEPAPGDTSPHFGQVALFGTQGVFVYGVSAFTLPKGALHRQAAVNFLSLVGTKQAEDRFLRVNGSIPPRLDADPGTVTDLLAQQTLDDFLNPTTRLTLTRIPLIKSVDFRTELEQVMRTFATDRKVDTVRHFLKNRYDEL